MTQYALLVEQDIIYGEPVIFLGYSHFHPALPDKEEFLILYCCPQGYMTPEYVYGLILGTAKRVLKKGEIVQWDKDQDTKDIRLNIQNAPEMPGVPRDEHSPDL